MTPAASMNPNVLLAIPLLPLAAAIIAGLFGRVIGRTAAHVVTIAAVGVAFLLSAQIAWQLISGVVGVYNESVYTISAEHAWGHQAQLEAQYERDYGYRARVIHVREA